MCDCVTETEYSCVTNVYLTESECVSEWVSDCVTVWHWVSICVTNSSFDCMIIWHCVSNRVTEGVSDFLCFTVKFRHNANFWLWRNVTWWCTTSFLKRVGIWDNVCLTKSKLSDWYSFSMCECWTLCIWMSAIMRLSLN